MFNFTRNTGAAQRAKGVLGRGFTLMEVLICVLIVSILASILFFVTRSTVAKARETECASNLKQLATAIRLYSDSNDGDAPPYTNSEKLLVALDPDAGEYVPTKSQWPNLLIESLQPYVRTNALWFCPTDSFARENVFIDGIRHSATSYLFFPASVKKLKETKQLSLGLDSDIASQPLLQDACGIPTNSCDSRLQTGSEPTTNHADGSVNQIGADLSLKQVSCASLFQGAKK
ncbi:MAG TPA: type II secretion system protein [Fimbriimonas sp.]|nr:type II secretion system protein [Fimbriimonas sp.]